MQLQEQLQQESTEASMQSRPCSESLALAFICLSIYLLAEFQYLLQWCLAGINWGSKLIIKNSEFTAFCKPESVWQQPMLLFQNEQFSVVHQWDDSSQEKRASRRRKDTLQWGMQVCKSILVLCVFKVTFMPLGRSSKRWYEEAKHRSPSKFACAAAY